MKEKVEEAIFIMGLVISVDNWDVEGKGWLRVFPPKWMNIKDRHYKKYGVVIIYKDDGYDVIMEELRDFMLKLGEYQFKQQLNKLIVL